MPYIRSLVVPGDFQPITAYLFVEYKMQRNGGGRGATID
jgi:hypothetical protein